MKGDGAVYNPAACCADGAKVMTEVPDAKAEAIMRNNATRVFTLESAAETSPSPSPPQRPAGNASRPNARTSSRR
jgi:hypothetical protein